MKIYEHDHFYKTYEDYRNNLYMLLLNDDVEKWIEENLTSSSYDINVDDYLNYDKSYIIIEFQTKEDAMAFKLVWI